MRVVCELCATTTDKNREAKEFKFLRYDDWIRHLIGKGHRSKVKEGLTKWKSHLNKQSIVVFPVSPPQRPFPLPEEILRCFSEYGFIADFYYHDGSFCVIRIDRWHFQKAPRLESNTHFPIGNAEVQIRSKCDILVDEWNVLLKDDMENQNGRTSPVVAAFESLNIEVQTSSSDGQEPRRRVTSTSATMNNNSAKDKNPFFSVPLPSSSSSAGVSSSVDVPKGKGKKQNNSNTVKNELKIYDSPKNPSKSKAAKKAEFYRTVIGGEGVLSPVKAGRGTPESNRKSSHSKEALPTRIKVEPVEVKEEITSADSKMVGNSLKVKDATIQFRGGFNCHSAPSTTQSESLPEGSSQKSSVQQKSSGEKPKANFHSSSNQNGQVAGGNSHLLDNRSQRNNQQQHQPAMGSIQRYPNHPVFQNTAQWSQQVRQMHPQQNYHAQPGMHPINYQRVHPQQLYNSGPQFRNPNPPTYNLSQQNTSAQFPVNQQQQRSYNESDRIPTKFSKFFEKLLTDPNSAHRMVIADSFKELALRDQLVEFVAAVSLTEMDKRMRRDMLQDLEIVLKSEFPNSLIYPFGSFYTDLGDSYSDVDVYFDAFGITKGKSLPKEGSSTLDILNRCHRVLRRAKCLRSNRPFCNQLIPIREARVPILKLRHCLTGVNCDLSFENLTSVRNSKMILFYMQLHPVVQPLLMLLRYWGRFHDLTGSSSIKNYGLILLALVFLGIKKIVPTVAMLQDLQKQQNRRNKNNLPNSDVIDGWDTSFCDDIKTVYEEFKPSISLKEANSNIVGTVGQLAGEFFELYANTNFVLNAICSYTSEILPKVLFSAGNEEDLPMSLDRYKEWSAQQTTDRRLSINTPLCIQDPFILRFNVGGVTPQFVLFKFQVACAQTAQKLKSDSFATLLDSFIALPSDVGDKKFISMQEKHKITEELKQEIESSIKYRGSSQPVDTKAVKALTEEVPVHLLPLNKIIDKTTVKRGKGWESYFRLEPDKAFISIFTGELVRCKLLGTYTDRSLLDKLKVLWVSYIEDFVDLFWRNVFKLEVVREEFTVYERLFQNGPLSNRRQNPAQKIFQDGTKKRKKNNTAAESESELNPEHVTCIKDKLSNVAEIKERSVYQKLTCTAYQPVWQKRDRAFKELFIKDNASESTDKSLKLSRKKVTDARKNLKDKQRSCNANPLAVEEGITNKVLEIMSAAELKCTRSLFSFNVYIKMECSFVDDFPSISFVFDKEDGPTSIYNEGTPVFAELFSETLPDYCLHRLKSWLSCECGENVTKVPKRKGTTAVKTEANVEAPGTSFSKDHVTFGSAVQSKVKKEEDENNDHLLLPPSDSESESSSDEDDNESSSSPTVPELNSTTPS